MSEKSRQISERARLARNAYQRKYRRENRDKIMEINARYWEKVADRQEGEDVSEERNS